MNIDEEQKHAIIDVINLLKRTFDIKVDDQVVLNQNLTEKERALNSQAEGLQRREREFKQSISLRLQQIKQDQSRIREQQADVARQSNELQLKLNALDSQEKAVLQRLDLARVKEAELKLKEDSLVAELEKIASMSKKDAIDLLSSKIESEARVKAENHVKEIMSEASQNASMEAQKILAYTIQKESTHVVSELATSTVDLTDDSLKGKIIGREGRNIKAFEELTGVTVLIDDTPEMVVLSSYDPIRREIAKISMAKLIADGRIHPQRIEEVVAQSTRDFDENLINVGRSIAIEFQIVDLAPNVLQTLGKLKYRTSFSQNVLSHSKEVALIASDIAAELKLDSKLLLRVGLLHDIGKALDRNTPGPHAQLGAEYLKQHGESENVCKLVAEHHDNETTSILTWIIKTADTISSARPGARLDAAEAYIKRLQDLETIATSFEGVRSSFAVLAGREIRIVVEPEKVSDADAATMADQIKDKIQKTMTYPGQIKVVVIREMRHIQLA